MGQLPTDLELQKIIEFVEGEASSDRGRFVEGFEIDDVVVLSILKELQELRALDRALRTHSPPGVFPNKLVETMFRAYCHARRMNPEDWPIIGAEKQSAWMNAASAAHHTITDGADERVERVLNDRKGYHVDDLDDETRIDLLGAIVAAVAGPY